MLALLVSLARRRWRFCCSWCCSVLRYLNTVSPPGSLRSSSEQGHFHGEHVADVNLHRLILTGFARSHRGSLRPSRSCARQACTRARSRKARHRKPSSGKKEHHVRARLRCRRRLSCLHAERGYLSASAAQPYYCRACCVLWWVTSNPSARASGLYSVLTAGATCHYRCQ